MRGKILRWSAILVGSCLALALGWGISFFHDRPTLAPYAAYRRPAVPLRGTVDGIKVTFLGASTLLLSDGETTLMTDGFFTHPSLWKLLLGRPLAPDPELVARALADLRVRDLAAVLVVHSHYDHVMDAPEVARLTGALLVGSASTANVGRGGGLSEEQIRVVEPGVGLEFGRFRVTFLESRHVPLPAGVRDEASTIDEPLVPPVAASAYREGGSYSVWIEHPWGNALVQGSAGWIEGGLEGVKADAVFLGIGGLGRQDAAYLEGYYRGVVEAVGASRILPIHWDDFTLPYTDPMRPLPRIADDVGKSLDFLLAKTNADPDVRVELAPERRPMLLFGPR